jgi:outer membrane biogenesis lipoprotein LolB
MMRRRVLAVLCLLLAGCSSQQVYDSSQGWRQNECNKLLDPDKQRACLEQADKSYDEYQRQKKAAEGK